MIEASSQTNVLNLMLFIIDFYVFRIFSVNLAIKDSLHEINIVF